jgi:hypothetical protein
MAAAENVADDKSAANISECLCMVLVVPLGERAGK